MLNKKFNIIIKIFSYKIIYIYKRIKNILLLLFIFYKLKILVYL